MQVTLGGIAGDVPSGFNLKRPQIRKILNLHNRSSCWITYV